MTATASANPPVIGKGAIPELYGTKFFNVAGPRASCLVVWRSATASADRETVFGLRPAPLEVIAAHEVNDDPVERV